MNEYQINNYPVIIINNRLNLCYTKRNKIFISENLINDLQWFEINVLLYHELGHLKMKHHIKNQIIILLLLIINIISILFISNLFVFLIGLIFSLFFVILINYFFEYRADLYSVEKTNILSVISLLHNFKNKQTFTHPSYIQRIAFIENFYLLFKKY